MVIAAFCTITKIQKQPKCPSKDEWIKKSPYSEIKIKIMKSCHLRQLGWIYTKIIMLSEISQTEKDK